MSFSKSEIAASNKRFETVRDELLDILTRPRDDDFSEVILRAQLVTQASGIGSLLDQIAAAGTFSGDQMRREVLLSAAVMLLNRLCRE